MFGQNQAECCSGEAEGCLPTATVAAATPHPLTVGLGPEPRADKEGAPPQGWTKK